MHKYNDEMKKGGVLLLAEGLHATSKGARIKVAGACGRSVAEDGPWS